MSVNSEKKAQVKKSFHLYDKQDVDNYLQNLKLAHHVFGITRTKKEEEESSETQDFSLSTTEATEKKLTDLKVAENWTCSSCNVEFNDVSEQRNHFKLDWHRYNVKSKLEDKPPITEEQFDAIVQGYDYDKDHESDLSISGSDESSSSEDEDDDSKDDYEEDENMRRKHRHPWFFFENQNGLLMSVHKCVLTHKNDDVADEQSLGLVSCVPRRTKWAVFMLGGGHFAGAVFHGKDVVVHKTFHCYTVRAKQGGSQGSADNKSATSHPRSAGASLRRYNEQALIQHVQDVITQWREHIAGCHLVFYRAVSGNKQVLFGGKDPPLNKVDNRLRVIPFPTRRATFKEIKRVHDLLSSVQIHGDSAEFTDRCAVSSETDRKALKKKAKRTSNIRRSKSREIIDRALPEIVQDLAKSSESSSEASEVDELRLMECMVTTKHLQEFENTAPPPRRKRNKKNKKNNGGLPEESREDEDMVELKNLLVTACKSGNKDLLKQCISDVNELEDFSLTDVLNEHFGESRVTLLHIAAKAGHKQVLWTLLESGADPSRKDKLKKVPYHFAEGKDVRNVFRRFQGQFPDKYDYKASQIPGPLTEEDEAKQNAKKQERKKAQRQAKKEKEKIEKEKEKELAKEEREKQRFLGLSDREKCALAAERRLLAKYEEAGSSTPVLLRCFSCGADITGKVPFEYESYKFCTPKCVREHRNLSQKK